MYALGGMTDVMRKKCGQQNYPKLPPYGVSGSKAAEMCAQHARDRMVNLT